MKRGLLIVCLCTLAGLAMLIAGVSLLNAQNFHMGLVALCGAAGWGAAVYTAFFAYQAEVRGPEC